MCVLAFAWRIDPRWPVVLLGNRDERHDRPATVLGPWEGESILAGRDMLSGGTWLGVSDRGLAVVTNFSTGQIATGPSRGALVPDFLRGSPGNRLGLNPFNLVTFGAEGARFASNYPVTVEDALEPGLYALANGGLDEHVFRADAVRASLAAWLMLDDEPEALLTPLGPTGSAPEGEKPVFIRNPDYGTRCSTVVAVDASGHGRIIERSFNAEGSATGEIGFDFEWPFVDALSAI